jgi:rubrerythrin
LETFLDTSQQPVEGRLEASLDMARARVDNQIIDLERHRGRILDAQPWDGDRSPTVTESQGKARTLISDIMGSDPDSSLGGATLDALIAYAEDALQHQNSQGKSALQKELEEVGYSLEWTIQLAEVQQDIEGLHLENEEWQKKLDAILDGKSADEIRNNRNRERLEADTRALHDQIVKNSIELLNRDQTGSVPCPVCGTEHARDDLESMLEQSESTSQLSGGEVALLNELDDQVKQIEEHEREIQKIQGRVTSLEHTAGIYREEAKDDGSLEDILRELTPSVSADQLESVKLKLLERKTEVGRLISDQQHWLLTLQIRISKLKEEERFHQIQKDRTRWIEAKNRFQEVERAYAELTSFGESVHGIENAVRASLIEKLEEETPRLSENLTKAFVALTHHVWYNQLIIDKSRLPTLELLVASSQDPSGLGSPIDVLNGQAEGALDLVPYFAFSQADNSPVEVHLVMLDDPTRAYDEDHIESLIESLAQLGSRVQLIVASQESERFRTLLPASFEPGSYSIIEPHGWSYHSGPELKVQYA